jgi:clan AA aspartic protease (TIGR02281 family)
MARVKQTSTGRKVLLAILRSGILGLSCAAIQAQANEVFVAEELSQLAKANGFEVEGEEHLHDGTAWVDEDSVYRRVRRLLDGFDHIILQDGQGRVSRVLIIGEKGMLTDVKRRYNRQQGQETMEEAPDLGRIVMATRRVGNQHAVDVGIEKANGGKLNQMLLIDTGASLVVLPRSMIAKLGIDRQDLSRSRIQTANGKIEGQVGTLSGVWLGKRRLEGVRAAFIEDGKLGVSGLLGMSALGRFQVTLDDEAGQLILDARGD